VLEDGEVFYPVRGWEGFALADGAAGEPSDLSGGDEYICIGELSDGAYIAFADGRDALLPPEPEGSEETAPEPEREPLPKPARDPGGPNETE